MVFRAVLFSFLAVFLYCESAISAQEVSVTPFSGRIKIQTVDYSFSGNNIGFQVGRVFHGLTPLSGSFGRGWSHNYEIRIINRDYVREVDLVIPGVPVITFRQTAVSDENGSRKYTDEYRADGRTDKIIRDTYRTIYVADGDRYFFNFDGNLSKIIYKNGLKQKFMYSGQRLVRVEGPYGQSLDYYYDDRGLINGIFSSDGTQLHYYYDPAGRLTEVYQGDSLLRSYRYDGLRLVAVTSPVGFAWYLTYDGSNRVAKLMKPFGYTETYEYGNGADYVFYSVINPEGGKTEYRYFPDSEKYEVVNPLGGVDSFEYSDSMLKRVTKADGTSASYTYDDEGRLDTVTDSLGRETSYDYEYDSDRVSTMHMPDMSKVHYGYDEQGRLTSLESDRGKFEISYDKSGRKTEIKTFDGKHIKYEYGEGWIPTRMLINGEVAAEAVFTDDGGVSSIKTGGRVLDSEKVTQEVAEVMRTSLPEYDYTYAYYRIKTDSGNVNYSYDKLGNLIQVTLPTGSIREYEYNPAGLLSAFSVDSADVFKMEYDKSGKLLKIDYADGHDRQLTYDESSRLISVKATNSPEYKFKYENGAEPVEVAFKGYKKKYVYDGGSLKSVSLHLDTGDVFKNLLGSFMGPDMKVSYGYKKTDDGEYFNIESPGLDITYTYSNSKLQQIQDKFFGEFSYSRDPESIRTVYPNSTAVNFIQEDSAAVISALAGTDSLYGATVVWDENGNIVKRTVNGVAETYMYDDKNRLIRAEKGADVYEYTYDSFSNRLTKTVNGRTVSYKYSPSGAMVKDNGADVSWDIRGNMLSRAGTKFYFDSANNLRRIQGADGTINYEYDENGMLISRDDGQEKKFYVYDGLNLTAVLKKIKPDDKSPSVYKKYIYEPGTNKVLAMSRFETVEIPKGNGKVKTEIVERKYYFHRNELDSIVLVTDETGGKVSEISYHPFGGVKQVKGSLTPELLFGGHLYEPAYGLYYMKARFYDAAAGRFLSFDPVKNTPEEGEAGLNLYAYAKNNPVSYTDPTGMMPVDPFRETLQAMTGEEKSNLEYLKTGVKGVVKDAPDTLKSESYGLVRDSAVNMGTEILQQKIVDSGTEVVYKTVDGGYFKLEKIVDNKMINRAEALGKTVSHGWNAYKLYEGISKGYDKYQKGEMNGEQFVKQVVIVETGGTAAGYYVNSLAASGLQGMSALSGPAIGFAVVSGWSVNQVKGAVTEALKLSDALELEEKLKDGQVANDRRLVKDRLMKIQHLQAEGNLDSLLEAERLAHGLEEFTWDRMDADSKMGDLFDAADDISDKLRKSIKAVRKQQTAEFEAEMAERDRIREEFEQQLKTESGVEDEPQEDTFAEAEDDMEQVEFEEPPMEAVAQAHQDIEQDKEQRYRQTEQRIAQKGAQVVEAARRARQQLAQGMMALQAGLVQYQQQYRAQQAQMKARIDEHNRKMQMNVKAYHDAHVRGRRQLVEKYGPEMKKFTSRQSVTLWGKNPNSDPWIKKYYDNSRNFYKPKPVRPKPVYSKPVITTKTKRPVVNYSQQRPKPNPKPAPVYDDNMKDPLLEAAEDQRKQIEKYDKYNR